MNSATITNSKWWKCFKDGQIVQKGPQLLETSIREIRFLKYASHVPPPVYRTMYAANLLQQLLPVNFDSFRWSDICETSLTILISPRFLPLPSSPPPLQPYLLPSVLNSALLRSFKSFFFLLYRSFSYLICCLLCAKKCIATVPAASSWRSNESVLCYIILMNL